ncbi:aspartyl/asparaginyl beta-hydroxylase domain-containing protein [Sphingomicrobium flavum]|uniref:aspartyl/asparaginyl beta-hydroxylase domain-containing protein n=1 Tax=Sphingomicrobium flavum TaxID=1229164 RepID=UPI0021AE0460|nr:aspartyl/asparaginyl beta-hydroxylase domain-containing protein [Sphingomicrobium flavum]
MRSEAEIDRILAEQPENFEALIHKGRLLEEARNIRSAAAYYRNGLSVAVRAGPLSPEFRPLIDMAQAGLVKAQQAFLDYQERTLAEAGFPVGKRPPRFQKALDILHQKIPADIGIQQPTAFYFPDLPQHGFFERQDFSWVADLEAATDDIRAELAAELARDKDEFQPYLVSDPQQLPSGYHGMADNPDWGALYLFQKGQRTDVADRFPKTMAAIEKADLTQIGVRAPTIMFSRLLPGARIPAHHGLINSRLICHLPLIVPPDCGFRVGDEVREWEEGKLLLFDDSVNHEAWNNSNSERIILLFDVWKPDISADERAAIAAMFEAIDRF